MKIRTAKQTSVVTGKEQYYLILQSDLSALPQHVISVGKKTYETTTNLIEHDQNLEIDKPLDLKDETKKSKHEKLK